MLCCVVGEGRRGEEEEEEVSRGKKRRGEEKVGVQPCDMRDARCDAMRGEGLDPGLFFFCTLQPRG